MRKFSGTVLYAASDLNGFLGCRHSTFLDLKDLEERLPRAEDDAQARLVQDRGHEHEAEYLDYLKKAGLSVVKVSEDGDLEDRVANIRRRQILKLKLITDDPLPDGPIERTITDHAIFDNDDREWGYETVLWAVSEQRFKL